MSNQITTLAATKIGTEKFTVELHELPGVPATVIITWLRQSLAVSELRFPAVAATITRLLSNASLELARMKAGEQQ
jgi:hypothetical protein